MLERKKGYQTSFTQQINRSKILSVESERQRRPWEKHLEEYGFNLNKLLIEQKISTLEMLKFKKGTVEYIRTPFNAEIESARVNVIRSHRRELKESAAKELQRIAKLKLSQNLEERGFAERESEILMQRLQNPHEETLRVGFRLLKEDPWELYPDFSSLLQPKKEKSPLAKKPLKLPKLILNRGSLKYYTSGAETPADERYMSAWESYVNNKGSLNQKEKVLLDFLKSFEDYILYEDGDLLVINKPPFIPSHFVNEENPIGVMELANYWDHYRDHIELGHRIDEETSGILVLTRNNKANLAMKNQFANKSKFAMNKIYTALVYGEFNDNEFNENGILHVEVPLKDDGKRMRALPYNILLRKSVTNFQRKELYRRPSDGVALTLLSVNIVTGMKNQIRAVSEFLGHPLAGDYKYSGDIITKDNRDEPRLLLHATSLSFRHPGIEEKEMVDKEMHIKSDLPEDFKQYLGSLEKIKEY